MLTEEEADILVAAGSTQHNLVLGWLGNDCNAMVRKGQLDLQGIQLTDAIGNIHGEMGSIHDSFVQNQPNSYTSVMVLVTDVLLMLAFLGFPLSVSARRKLRSTIHCQCAVSSWQEVGTMAFYCKSTVETTVCVLTFPLNVYI